MGNFNERIEVTLEVIGQHWLTEDKKTRHKSTVGRKVNGANFYLSNREMEAAFDLGGDGGVAITPAGRYLWQQWDAQQKAQDTLYRALKKQKSPAPKPTVRTVLRIAADDTVRCTLLTLVAEQFRLSKRDVEFKLEEMGGPSTYAAPAAGLLDVAIGWSVPKNLGPATDVVPLGVYADDLYAVFRATHALAEDSRKENVSVKELASFPLVFPPIPSVKDVLESCRVATGKPLIPMQLPALGHYLVTTDAVGIVPGWPWLLRDLRRRFGLRAVRFQAPEMDASDRPSQLHLVTHAGALLSDESIQSFADVLRQVIEEQSVAGWDAVLCELDTVSLAGKWYCYYVTQGPDARHAMPMWAVAEVTLMQADAAEANLCGKLVFRLPFHGEQWNLDVAGEVVAWKPVGDEKGVSEHHTLVLRTRHHVTKEPAVMTFYKRVQNRLLNGLCLTGIAVFTSITGRLTASPVLLSREEIDESTRIASIRQELVDLTSPDVVVEPSPMETHDGRR